jgi:acyl-CoA synthetase (NDP forming)
MPSNSLRAALTRLFNPATVAIIGASDDTSKYSGRIVEYCLRAGMAGRLRLVNPSRQSIRGLACFPSLSAVDDQVDVAIAMVAPARLPAVIEQCDGVAAAIVVGDLVARSDAAAKQTETAIKAQARSRGLRLVGPQCVGIVSPVSGTVLSISSALAEREAGTGRVALISQSGGLVASIIDRAGDAGCGFSRVISCGGEVDLTIEDYLEFLVDDDETGVISIYAEGIRDPGRFLTLADRAAATSKPVLMLMPGRSEAGAAAALSHSGRLSGRYDVREAILKSHGIQLVDDLDDLWLAATMLARHRCAPNGGVAAVSLSGGYTAVLGDRLTTGGVPMATLSAATRARLARDIQQPNAANPLDAGARPTPGQEAADVGAAIAAFEDEPDVAAILYAETMFLDMESVVPYLAASSAATRKPLLVCWQTGKSVERVMKMLAQHGVLGCTDLAQAVRALALFLASRDRRVRGTDGGHVARPRPDMVCGEFTHGAATELLAAFGVDYENETLASDAAGAAAAAERMGYPVVLKGVIPGCLHKTDQGLVKLGLATRSEVIAAAGEMERLPERPAAFAVQRQISGLELIVGIIRDPDFGPALLLAWGGIFAEAMNRRVLSAPPPDVASARDMIAAIDPNGILNGYRTGRAYAVEKLAQLLVNVGRMAMACPWLDQLDLNPIILNAKECVAVDQVMLMAKS